MNNDQKKATKKKAEPKAAPPPPRLPQQGRPQPPLPGVFEDYFYVEVHMQRPLQANPNDLDGWYVAAMPRKAFKNHVNTTAFVSYCYDPQSGLLAVPHAFRLMLTKVMQDTPQGPMPTVKLSLKYHGDVVLRADAIAHTHECLPSASAADQDWSMMALNVLRESMSVIERPAGAGGIIMPK